MKVKVVLELLVIEEPLLQEIAKELKVPVEAIRNFDEEQAINIISNTASFENCQQPAFFNFQPSFNPMDKIVELYEALLKSEREKMEMLQRITNMK